jgi:hypothetical protein
MEMKIADYFEGANPRAFTLAREIFGNVLPIHAIDEIERMELGRPRAEKALEVFCQFRDPPAELKERLRQAFMEEPSLYVQRGQTDSGHTSGDEGSG